MSNSSDQLKGNSLPRDVEVLNVKGLKKEYEGHLAVEDVTFSIPGSQIVFLVGSNGSGKTTILRLIAGLLKPDLGTISIFGARAGSEEARSVVSYIADEPSLYDDLSVREHLYFSSRFSGDKDPSDKVENLLEKLDLRLRADALPYVLSRGMRQRVSLGMGFVRSSKLVLIDEPFVGLDLRSKTALSGLLDVYKETGGSALVTTHSLEYLNLSDRCLVMAGGEIIYDGPPDPKDVEGLIR